MLQNCFPCFKNKINQEHRDINICNIILCIIIIRFAIVYTIIILITTKNYL